jgi:hypothetical protein
VRLGETAAAGYGDLIARMWVFELCREMGLLATASVAIDGSKFKAFNNRTGTSHERRWSGGEPSWRRALRDT